MFAVVGTAVEIVPVAGGGVVRVDERHVAFSATDGLREFAIRVPATLAPTVVLILPLNPAGLV